MRCHYRPGTEQLDGNPNGIAHFVDDESLLVPFPTSIDDPCMMVFGVSSGLPSIDFIRASTFEFFERVAVNSTITDGDFGGVFVTTGNADIGLGWADVSVGGSSASQAAGRLTLTGTGTDEAKTYQTTAATDANTAHGFFFTVDKGEVLVQIGTGGVDSADLFEAFFQIGYHHIEVESNASDDLTITISNANLRVRAGCSMPLSWATAHWSLSSRLHSGRRS